MVYSDLVQYLQHDGSTDTLLWAVDDQLYGQHVNPMCCSLMMPLILILHSNNNNSQ
jgi:hypothetical protein